MPTLASAPNQPKPAASAAGEASTFEALAAAQIKDVEELASGIRAHLIKPGVDLKLVHNGQNIAKRAFPGDSAALASCENNYRRLVAGETIYRIDAPGSADPGRDFESVCYFVDNTVDAAVGIAGAYRYLDEPRRYWLGRIAVDPDQRQHGFGPLQLNHIIQCVLRLGGSPLDAFTEDDASNAKVHAFYDRAGFERFGPIIHELGHSQRVYRRNLLQTDPR